MDREAVLEKLEPISKTVVRTMERNSRVKVTVTPEMVTLRPGGGQRIMEVTSDGVKSLANFCGLPWNLAARIQPDTFGTVATELLGQANRYALLVKGEAIVGVTKPAKYLGLDPTRVLRALEGGIKGLTYHRVLVLDDSTVSIEMVGERREPVVSGDLIQAGAQITFSPLGTIKPTVQGYALRCLCTNGMSSNIVLNTFSFSGGGDGGGDIWNWLKKSSRAAYGSINRIVVQYRKMMDEEVPPKQRALLLEALLKEARIVGNDAAAIRASAIENPPRTSYDLMNLVSNATSHLLEEPRGIRRAQEAVAAYSNSTEHSRTCPVCHHTSKPSKN